MELKVKLSARNTLNGTVVELKMGQTTSHVKLDIGGRVIYKEQAWAGLTYRHRDAVSFLLGYMYKDYLMIGYSYDITTTQLRKYSSGSHELMLGLKFTRKQASAWKSTK